MNEECQVAIQQLERRLTASRRRTWAVVCLGGLVVLMGQSGEQQEQPANEVADVLQTRRLEIVNESGQVVLAASADSLGAGQLAITHGDGTAMVNIGQRAYGEGVLSEYFATVPGHPKQLSPKHPPAMTLMWPNGKPLAVIGHEEKYGPTVVVYPVTGEGDKRLKLGTSWLVE